MSDLTSTCHLGMFGQVLEFFRIIYYIVVVFVVVVVVLIGMVIVVVVHDVVDDFRNLS